MSEDGFRNALKRYSTYRQAKNMVIASLGETGYEVKEVEGSEGSICVYSPGDSWLKRFLTYMFTHKTPRVETDVLILKDNDPYEIEVRDPRAAQKILDKLDRNTS